MLNETNASACLRAIAIAFILTIAAEAKPTVAQTAATDTASANTQGNAVTMDLAVRDRHNKPVLDLRPEELSIADNNAPAKLTNLKLVSGKLPNEPLVTLFFERPGMQDKGKKSEDVLFGRSALAARESSNKLRDAATKFLKGFPDTGFQFGVVDVWGRLQIQQGLGADRKATAQAVAAAIQPETYGSKVAANTEEKRLIQIAKTGQDATGAASTQQRAVARSMYAALQSSSHTAKDQHLPLTLACLLSLVEAQESLPGRKAIVYFVSNGENSSDSDDWRRQDSRAREALRTVVGAANRAGINIYVVLPDEVQDTDMLSSIFSRASMTMTGSGAVDITGSFNPNMDSNANLVMATIATRAPSAASSEESLNMLAKQTGGDVLSANHSLSGAAKDLIRNMTTYYEVSFAPAASEEDGSFHATVFKTSRRGLKMRGRSGYLALPPSAGITEPPQPFELPLIALLKRTELPGEVDYRATVLRMGRHEEGNVGLLALEVPVSGLAVREDTSTHLNAAHVSVLANIKDSSGTVIERFSEDIARRWGAASNTGTTPAFISFERSFSAPPGQYVLETAILDSNSNKAAAKRQTFEISDSQSVLQLSDLMLVRGVEPAEAGSSEPDLLWQGEQRVQPNLYGQMPEGVHNLSVFFFAHADPKSQEPAGIKLEVLRDGVPLRGQPLMATLKSGAEFEPVLKSFAINSAADGDYQVRATMTQGGKSVETAGAFTLTGEEERGAGIGAGDAALNVDPPGLEASEQPAGQPTPEETERILADVRKIALDYGDALPNLICQQTTTRSADARGNGNWRLKDKYVEVLTYVDRQENRTVVMGEVNHLKQNEENVSKIGMISVGEFGVAMSNIFKPSSKAVFTRKGTGMMRGEQVESFDYRIEEENSSFSLVTPTAAARVGYHGRVYIDRATHGVRSLTIITNEVPKKFPLRRAAVRVDYDYVAINDHDYMLPVSAQVMAEQSGNLIERNDLEFSNFRKFGSNARILDSTTPSDQQ